MIIVLNKADVKTIDEHAKDLSASRTRQAGFEDLSIEDQKRFLLECLDKIISMLTTARLIMRNMG